MSIALFVFAILGVVLVFGGGLFYTIVTLLVRASGWKRLAEFYACSGPAPQPCWERQTVRIGSVRFRNSMRMAATPQGLYLHTRFASPDLLIPWLAVSAIQPTTMYWQSAYVLSIGQPEMATVSLFENQYQWITAYLNRK